MLPRSTLWPVSRSIPTPPEISEPLEVLVRSPINSPALAKHNFMCSLALCENCLVLGKNKLTSQEQHPDIPGSYSSLCRVYCCCSVAKLCPTLCDPMDCRMPGSHPLPSPGVCSNSCPMSWWCYLTISSFASPFSFWLQSFPHQGLSQWLGSSHQVAKVLEFKL